MPNDYEKFKPQNEMAENKETSSENKETNEIGPEQAVEIVQQQVVEAINIGETTLNTTMKKLEANPEEISEASTELSAINEEIAELGESVTEEITEPNETGTEKFAILPDESPEEYLARILRKKREKGMADLIFSKGNNMRREFKKITDTKIIDQILLNILKNSDKGLSTSDNKTNSNIHLNKGAIPFGEDAVRNSKNFAESEQGRNFFTQSSKHDRETYAESLFLIPVDPEQLNSEQKKLFTEYFKKVLDNKNILMLGGGDSIKDLLKNPDIKPNKVINADPFLNKETFDKNPQGNYYNLDKKADDPSLSEYFKEQNIKADEIWASYSVPLYLKTPEELSGLFDNIQNILNEGGKCRIYPLDCGYTEQLPKMNTELTKIIGKMTNSGNFKIEIFPIVDRANGLQKQTMIITKLRK